MFGTKNNNSPKEKTTSLLNSLVSGTVITGKVFSKMDIRIDGKLEGSLNCDAKVVVGKNALIVGDISCQTILIEGRVEGNISAKEKLHIQSCGTVLGDLITNKLIIEDGANFNGASVMGNKASVVNNENGKFRESQKDISKEVLKAS